MSVLAIGWVFDIQIPSEWQNNFSRHLTFHFELGMFSTQRVASRLCLFFPPDK